MFVHFPYYFTSTLRHTVLLINTVLLIAALITVEILYGNASLDKRRELRYFLPLFIVLCSIFVLAIKAQTGSV